MNWLLDEYDTLRVARRNRDERSQRLQRAGLASVRGIEALIEDQRTKKFRPPDPDVYRLLEDMRQDEALLRLFLKTESRLLEDLGVSREAIQKIEKSLGEVLLELNMLMTLPGGEAAPKYIEDSLAPTAQRFAESLAVLDEKGASAASVGEVNAGREIARRGVVCQAAPCWLPGVREALRPFAAGLRCLTAPAARA